MPLREVKASTNLFDELCAQYEFENGKKRRAELALEKIKAQLLTATEKIADKKTATATSDVYRVKITSFDRETIDKAKLLQLGVKATVIRKATKSTPVRYPLVTNLEEEARKKAEKETKKETAALVKRARRAR